ncbi:MAG: hypothetical protein JWP29_5225 [Rhodoferax sp.]|nr:hypothetical protein [Rhodoferax sp.]
MNDFLSQLVRFMLRIVLVGFALVFAASLLVVVLLLATVWGLRAAWAKLTGRPIAPWVMRVDPGAGWNRVFRAGDRWQPARGAPSAAEPAPGRPDLLDVTDVQVKEVRSH